MKPHVTAAAAVVEEAERVIQVEQMLVAHAKLVRDQDEVTASPIMPARPHHAGQTPAMCAEFLTRCAICVCKSGSPVLILAACLIGFV